MTGHLELLGWINLVQPVHAVAFSANGQYLAAGHERGAALFNLVGERLLSFPDEGGEMPVKGVALHPDLTHLYLVTRPGWLIDLELKNQDGHFTYQAKPLYQVANDLYSLSFAPKSEYLAIGHLGPAISVLKTDGEIMWRRHSDDGTATEGRTWVAALDADGKTLFLGCGGAEVNRLLCVRAADGSPTAQRWLYQRLRATNLAVLPNAAGLVVSLVEDMYTSHLHAYDAGLEELLWEQTFDEPITALAVDATQPVLGYAAGYQGRVGLINAKTGTLLTNELFLNSLVNSLTLVNGSALAAATEDGHLAILRYLPQELRL